MKQASLVFAAILAIGSSLQAAVVPSSDVAGYGTFRDTNTDRIWLKLDNFFGKSASDMVATANDLGFTFADRADVEELVYSLPLFSGEWPTYASVMGSAPNRDLIWGVYDSPTYPTQIGWAYSYNLYSGWELTDLTAFRAYVVVNDGTADADMNIWAYQSEVTPTVPEPTTIIIWSLLGGLGLVYAWRKRKAA